MAVTTRNSSGQRKKPVPQEKNHSSQVLLQKPATVTEATKTVTVNSQQVSVEQSLQLVQTILHGCLAHILFQRSLYPQNCYQSRYFNPDGPEWSYKDSIGGKDRAVDTPNGSPIFSLKKGVSERTDRLLDLLVACSYSYICYN
jgi:meiosis-specific protein HOP1